MKYSPPISDSQNIPLSRSFSLWATIFFIAVLAPAFLLSNLLENLKEELVHAKFEDHLNHARALMAKLDKELDPISIIQEALEKFRKKVEIKAVSQNLNSKSAAIFDQVFRKIFPESSKIFWFDPNQNLIHLEGNPQIAGGRTWQTFFSLLSGKPISDLEKRLASNLVLTVFGELVTVNYLKGAFRQAIEVLIGGEKNLFSILRFKNGDMILGYSLVFIPLSRAPPGWELEHVIRIHGNQNEMVGGFWKSKQDGNGSGILNSGLMHGLSESMTSSYSCWIGESFVYAQPRSQDPDFILVVGVNHPNGNVEFSQRKVEIIENLLLILTVLLGVVCFLFSFKFFHFSMSLSTKFTLGAILLASTPMSWMVVIGLSHAARLIESQKTEMEMTLENILCGIEQQVANEIVFMERRLEKLQHSPALLGARDKESIKSFFGKEDRECLNRLLYIHKEDKDIKEGLKIEEGWGGTSPLVSFHGQIAQETFKKSGFKIPEKLFPIKITPEVQAFKENVEGLHKMDPLKKLGKLSPLHLGPDSSFLFATFIKNASDSLSAYIQLGFNYRKAVNNFLAKAQREIKIGRVILRPIRRDSPVGLRRAHNEIEKLLDIAQYTGERIVNQIRHKNQNFISLSRPLRGLGIPALALLPEKEFESPVFLIKGLLTIVVLFAALSAIFGITLMRRFLLKPMLEITKTVSLVDHGDYQIRAPTTALDELGEISHSLNLMLDGLRQKSRMTFFLRRELVVKAPQNNHNQVTKKFVVVTFAGLRNFSRLESLLSPEEAFSIMSQFLVICETSVKKFRGDIDKFVGDTAMAVFQIDPFKSCEKRAIMSAIELSEEVKTWMRKRREKGLPVIQHGIGIAAGVVLAGGVGSFRKRLDFTVIGDPVNLAARLEKIAGTNLNPEILATENFSGIKIPGIRIVPTEIHSIRGKRKPMSVFGVRRG